VTAPSPEPYTFRTPLSSSAYALAVVISVPLRLFLAS
jgi:hypothetical protein